MNITIEIDGERREVTPEQFVAACEAQGVEMALSMWNRILFRGPREPVGKARLLLEASPELEAALLLRMAETDPELAVAIEERAAIMETDDLLTAARGTRG